MTVGTLADLAALHGMPSQPSLRRMIAARPDFPVLQRGSYGVSYRLNLEVAAAFVREHWLDGRSLRRERRRCNEDQLALFAERDL